MESSSSGIGSGNSDVIVSTQRMRIENPFTLKVGQVFTGFGIGCGLGIGVGRPLNLGAIPVLNQVMGATRGATDVFSGVGRHVNDSLRKLGAKNIETGIGCGVGFGHGFGVGWLTAAHSYINLSCTAPMLEKFHLACGFLALTASSIAVFLAACGSGRIIEHIVMSCREAWSGASNSIFSCMTKMMVKFGIVPNLSLGQGLIPASLQSGMMPSTQNPIGSIMQLATKVPDQTPLGLPTGGNLIAGSSYETFASKQPSLDPSYGSRTEKVISSFLQNPILKDEDSEQNKLAGRLRSENNILQMVLKHQQVIEELLKENEKLREILVEDLKIPPSKLQASYSSGLDFVLQPNFEES